MTAILKFPPSCEASLRDHVLARSAEESKRVLPSLLTPDAKRKRATRDAAIAYLRALGRPYEDCELDPDGDERPAFSPDSFEAGALDEAGVEWEPVLCQVFGVSHTGQLTRAAGMWALDELLERFAPASDVAYQRVVASNESLEVAKAGVTKEVFRLRRVLASLYEDAGTFLDLESATARELAAEMMRKMDEVAR